LGLTLTPQRGQFQKKRQASSGICSLLGCPHDGQVSTLSEIIEAIIPLTRNEKQFSLKHASDSPMSSIRAADLRCMESA
jgi:hypothetical protein